MRRAALLASLLFLSCATTQPVKEAPRNIDAFFDKQPTAEYSEVTKLFVDYRELGAFKQPGSSELMIERLKAEARKVGADGIVGIKVDTEQIPGQMNRIWKASATAIKYVPHPEN